MVPLVSIIIPAFNAETYLEETIRSALAQTWTNTEIIIVDDGSSDNTFQIAKAFESTTVKVIKQANAGASAARNKALTYAQGDYIQWLDHDDLLDPDKISKQLSDGVYAASSRILLSSPFGVFFHRPRRAKFVQTSLWQDLTPLEYFFLKFSENAFLQTSCWLVSRQLTELAGPWWEIRSPDDDGEYMCRVVAACVRIHFVPDAKVFWRVAHGGFSTMRTDASLESLFMSTCRSIEHFRGFEDNEQTRAACVLYLQENLSSFYPEKPTIVARSFALAQELGGTLHTPALMQKYRLFELVFGYATTKRFARLAARLKAWLISRLDKLLK